MAVFVLWCLGASVLSCHQHPGRRERSFQLVNFRTMTNECNASGALQIDVQRITAVSRRLRATSIDILAEPLNILRREIKLICPRPLLMQYLFLYSFEHSRRDDVMIGFSGCAQINGSSAISWEEKLRLDVLYGECQSFWLDVRIFLFETWSWIRREVISSAGQVAMVQFTGTSAHQ